MIPVATPADLVPDSTSRLTHGRANLPRLLCFAAVSTVLVVGCKDSDTIAGLMSTPVPSRATLTPSVPTPTPIASTVTPTPSVPTPRPTAPPFGSIAGDWFGTFDSVDFIDCDARVPASASFTLQVGVVDGILNAEERGCGASGVVFHGRQSGDQIEGTIIGGTGRYRFSVGSTATGVVRGNSLDLTLIENSPFAFPIPGGQMTLHR
jgi:hypothetical protein